MLFLRQILRTLTCAKETPNKCKQGLKDTAKSHIIRVLFTPAKPDTI